MTSLLRLFQQDPSQLIKIFRVLGVQCHGLSQMGFRTRKLLQLGQDGTVKVTVPGVLPVLLHGLFRGQHGQKVFLVLILLSGLQVVGRFGGGRPGIEEADCQKEQNDPAHEP